MPAQGDRESRIGGPLQGEPLRMEGTFDTVNTAFWDSQAGLYRSFTRYFENLTLEKSEADLLGPRPSVVRAIQSSTSPDFRNWTPPVHHRYFDSYTDRDPIAWPGQFARSGSPDPGLPLNDPPMQLYTNSTLPCPEAEHLTLAFPNRYVQERVIDPRHPYPGVNDALFMASRDAVRWKRYPEAWVRPGLDELNWTERNNYPTWGIVRTSPGEWSMYVSEHYRRPGLPHRLRRLSIRPHGFVSLRAGWGGGGALTRPFVFAGQALRLNYSTSAAGSLQVEVQDERGAPLPGFGLDEMDPLFGDHLERRVRWRRDPDLAALAGRPVRLCFALKDADLFAFQFA